MKVDELCNFLHQFEESENFRFCFIDKKKKKKEITIENLPVSEFNNSENVHVAHARSFIILLLLLPLFYVN